MLSDPETQGHSSSDNGDGTTHETNYWNDGDGVAQRESWNQDAEGNMTDYHYVQHDGHGSKEVYNYHTEKWDDQSK